MRRKREMVGTMVMVRNTGRKKRQHIIWEWQCKSCGYKTYATLNQMKSFKSYRCPTCEPVNRKIQNRIEKIGTMCVVETLGNVGKCNEVNYLWRCECGDYEVEATVTKIKRTSYQCPYCNTDEKYETMIRGEVVGKKYGGAQPVYLWRCECGKYEVEATTKEIKKKSQRCPHCFLQEQIKKNTMIRIRKEEGKDTQGFPLYLWECECGRFQVVTTHKKIHQKGNQCPFCAEEQQAKVKKNGFKILAKTDRKIGSSVVYLWECMKCGYQVEASKKQIEYDKYKEHVCKEGLYSKKRGKRNKKV